MTDDSQQNLSIYTQLRMSNTKIKSLTTIQYNDFFIFLHQNNNNKEEKEKKNNRNTTTTEEEKEKCGGS